LYNGTTYLPVRAISTLMNAKIDWDQETKTVLLETAEDENAEGYEAVVNAATDIAEYYNDASSLVLSYYRYYLKACTILDEGLDIVKEAYYAYGSVDGGLSLMKLEDYVMAYDGYQKEFGTYLEKCMSFCEFAKTVQGRVEKFAEGGYTAEELETLDTNTGYLNENKIYFSEYMAQSSPEYMVDYFASYVDALGEAIVLQLGNIGIE
ncbi:MAG: hypothetical protein J6S18_04655, partial [Oscillospiraceae bacterium]|nr:hypothetical protein [Oscillospiraceae bacterium]